MERKNRHMEQNFILTEGEPFNKAGEKIQNEGQRQSKAKQSPKLGKLKLEMKTCT